MGSSGDLLADRRYAWARAALKEDDPEAAAEVAAQALEQAPGFAAAWLLLGQARTALYRRQDMGEAAEAQRRAALEAFSEAARLDPEDALGARVWAAQLGEGDAAAAMSPAYIRSLFDDYAPGFERHLVRTLGYCGPSLLYDAVRRCCSRRLREVQFGAALDLGCGTGLVGELFRPACRHLAGVDLSPAMVQRARAKRIYDEVVVDELVAWLATRHGACADLALAADVFIYIGDPAPVFAEVARVLQPGGLFAFTVQTHPGAGSILGEDGRYAQSEGYVRAEAGRAGFAVELLEQAVIRQQRGADVPGLVAVLAR